MRIDKFLQLSRIVKQRSLAKELCEAGKLFSGTQKVKASYEVSEGDVFTLLVYNRKIKFEVLEVPQTKTISKQKAKTLYNILNEEIIES